MALREGVKNTTTANPSARTPGTAKAMANGTQRGSFRVILELQPSEVEGVEIRVRIPFLGSMLPEATLQGSRTSPVSGSRADWIDEGFTSEQLGLKVNVVEGWLETGAGALGEGAEGATGRMEAEGAFVWYVPAKTMPCMEEQPVTSM